MPSCLEQTGTERIAQAAGHDQGGPANPVGRDSVEPKLDSSGKSHGSTESRPTVHGGDIERAEPAIAVPLVFGKGQFESGVAARVLRGFAHDPCPYLDESAEMRWQESRPTEPDNMDAGPATETDLQSDLIEVSGNPF